MNLTQKQLAEVRRLASNLPPVTITITDPMDVTMLVSAFLMGAGNGKEGADMLGAVLGSSCRLLGIEPGVEAWLTLVGNTQKFKLPKFLKPLLIHYFTHCMKEKEKGKQ